MLATLVDEPFDRPGWVFEIKWDGYRITAEVERGAVSLFSRNRLDYTARYAPIVASLKKLRHRATLDGEVVVLDEAGVSSFQLLQNRMHGEKKGRLAYMVFDLLALDGKDLRSKPLLERKRLLKKILHTLPGVKYSDHVEERGVEFFEAAKEQGLEGIIAKDGASPYREGVRGREWLKIKTHQRQEVVVAGFTAPQRARKLFGALVTGVYKGKKLTYTGHVGGGFDTKGLKEAYAKLRPLIRSTSPFEEKIKTNTPVRWVKPVLVCDVAFAGWTDEGHMRHPIFVGWREDKPARKVVRERPRRRG